MKSRWLNRIWMFVQSAFKREDVPAVTPEKKRQYSIAGWVCGSDGVFRNPASGTYGIYQLRGQWYRDTPRSYIDGGVELVAVPYPSLHAAIKEETSQDSLSDAPLLTGGIDVQRDGLEIEIAEIPEGEEL